MSVSAGTILILQIVRKSSSGLRDKTHELDVIGAADMKRRWSAGGELPPLNALSIKDLAEDVIERILKFAIIAERFSPDEHPKAAVTAYDKLCAAVQTAQEKTRTMKLATTSLKWDRAAKKLLEQRFDADSICRNVLKAIFKTYGWTERLELVRDNYENVDDYRYHFCYRIHKTEVPLDLEKEPLPELRKLATMHLPRYVRDAGYSEESVRRELDQRELEEEEDYKLHWIRGPSVIGDLDTARALKDAANITERVDLWMGTEVKVDYDLLSLEFVKQPYNLKRRIRNRLRTRSSLLWNPDVSRWKPKRMINGNALFLNAKHFQGLGVDTWTMSKLIDARSMFQECTLFNSNLSSWNPVLLLNASSMFHECQNFRGEGVDKWTVPELYIGRSMFQGCTSFNSNLSSWKPVKLKYAEGMFHKCKSFRGEGVDKWTMSVLMDARCMFKECTLFNSNLSSWNPVWLHEASAMFMDCTSFTGDGLDSWACHLKNIQSSTRMFAGCSKLNFKNLKNWEITHNNLYVSMMFDRVPIADTDISCLITMCVNLREIRNYITWEHSKQWLNPDPFFEDIVEKYNFRGFDAKISLLDYDYLMACLIFGLNNDLTRRDKVIMDKLKGVVKAWRLKYPNIEGPP